MAAPESLRFQSVSTRNWILASFWFIAILATPVWWTTTTIERRPLPRSSVKQWSARSPCPVSIPIRVALNVSDELVPDVFPWSAEALSQQSYNDEKHASLQEWLEDVRRDVSTRLDVASRGAWLVPPPPPPPPADGEGEDGRTGGTASDAVAQDTYFGEHAACIVWDVIVSAKAETTVAPHGVNASLPFLTYDVSLTQGASIAPPSTSTGPRSFALSVSQTGQRTLPLSGQVSATLADLFQLPYPDLAAMQPAPPPGRRMLGLAHPIATDLRAIPFAQRVRLVFSLLNEDVSAVRPRTQSHEAKELLFGGVRGWTARGLDEALVDQLGRLVEDLQEVYDIGVESQVQWSAPLAFEPHHVLVGVHEELGADGGKSDAPTEGSEAVNEAPAPTEGAEPASAPAESAIGQVERDGEDQSFQDASENPDATADAADAAEVQEVEAALAVDAAIPDEQNAAAPEPAPETTSERYLIDTESLKSFINPADWSLASPSGPQTFPPSPFGGAKGAGRSISDDLARVFGNATRHEYERVASERTLHFILYVPSAKHQPLGIQEVKDGLTMVSPSKAWLLPQWGGVYLFNPSEELSETRPQRDGELAPALGRRELEEPLRTFRKQLSILLGLHPIDVKYRGRIPQLTARTMALDNMIRRRVLESSRESVQSMASIVRLVDKIGNLAVGRSVQVDVGRALELLEELQDLLLSGSASSSFAESVSLIPSSLSRALRLSGTAASLSSRAFFDPDMLGQLYFPEEHKYAVYTPLFGPVSVPLLVAAVRAWKDWRERKRRRKAEGAGGKDVGGSGDEKAKSLEPAVS